MEPELPPPEATPSPDLAHLSVNAVPWGYVSVDSVPVGNTPLLNLSLPPGRHIVRVERDGFRPWERDVQLAPGQVVRITDIGLVRQ